MDSLSRIFIGLGIFLIIIGILMKLPFFPLGRLPGDILIKKENVTFYFPIASSIAISIILSILFYLFTLFRK